MKEVEKKILPKYFKEVYAGNGYITTVTYVLRNVPEYGLAEGYCIIGWR